MPGAPNKCLILCSVAINDGMMSVEKKEDSPSQGTS